MTSNKQIYTGPFAKHVTSFAGVSAPVSLRLIALSIVCVLFATHCAPRQVSIGSPEQSHIKLPFVRTLLSDDSQSITIGSKSSIAIECIRGVDKFVYYSPQGVHARYQGAALSLLNSSGDAIETGLDVITVSSRSRNQPLSIKGDRYRGMVRLTPGEDALVVTNILNIDEYLKGVVPPEIGPVTSEDEEAIKAQAIAARTYTMSHLGQYGSRKYDVTSTVSDQLYLGMKVEKDIISKAVEATAGEVIRYKDQFIKAYYHSTCGGRTDNIENVWPKPPAPYLKSVDCQQMCSPSKYYHWKETFTGKQLAKRISDYETAAGEALTVSRIDSIYIDNSAPASPSPGLRTQKLVVVSGSRRFVYERDRIRWVFRRSSDPNRILQSDYFTLSDIQSNNRSGIISVTFNGRGYGHGVGMCQMGALGMARAHAGYTYRDILQRYYTNVSIDKLY